MISPYVRRLRLAEELRDLRAQAGLTHEELARRIGQSRAQISRLENADSVDLRGVIMILDALEVDEDCWSRIIGIARDAGERGWWESHKSMGSRQALRADLEAGARTIREFQIAIVPDLFQIPHYTRARLRSDYVTQASDRPADAMVQARQLRQRMLRRSGPTCDVILDEVAFRRLAVPPEVAKAQLYHIAALVNADPSFTLKVLPTDAVIAGYAMPHSSFSVYTFHDTGDPSVVVVDALTEDLVGIDKSYLQRYEDLFSRLSAAALSPAASLNYILDIARSDLY